MLRTWCAFAGLCAGGGGALSGTTSSLRSSCRLRRGEPTSENSGSFSPFLSFGCGSRPIKVQRKKGMQKCIPFFLVHFQGLLRPLGARAAASGGANRHPRIAIRSLPALSFGCGSRPTKVQRKKRCKNASHFSWCTFRDSNPGPID